MSKISSPLLNYENKWVALTPDREKVVASAGSIEQLEKKVRRLKNQDAIFTYVPPFDRILSL